MQGLPAEGQTYMTMQYDEDSGIFASAGAAPEGYQFNDAGCSVFAGSLYVI